MIKYIHTFTSGSGNNKKPVIRVYTDGKKAGEQFKLLGGVLESAQIGSVWMEGKK